MRLNKAIEGFRIARLADNTLQRYEGCLEKLSKYLDNPEISDIDIRDLRDFMIWLRNDYKPVRFGGDTSPFQDQA